jgi:hypothetical protein
MVKAREYEITDNGGQPFLVKIYKSHIDVYANYEEKDNFGELLLEIKNYEKVFLGSDEGDDDYYYYEEGNNILVKIGQYKYILIGMETIEFETDEEILEFDSPIGSNAVPYPYAIGKKYSYLFDGHIITRVPNIILPKINPSPFDNYMEIIDMKDRELNKFFAKHFNLESKVLIPRV